MIDRKYPSSRKNSLTSLSTVNSSMSTSTAASANALSNAASPSAVRTLSTNNLVTIDDKFVKKSFKRSTSEVNFHKAQGTYFFPNGEVFRPRVSPARRNKPGKINDDSSFTNQPIIPQDLNTPGRGAMDSNMYSYAPSANSTNIPKNYSRANSMVSSSNMPQQTISRSQSSSNVRKLQSKNLAQSLRLNNVDTPTNITLFQQHLNQQHQQHQPGQLPQQYSQQFQQFQQHQSQQFLHKAMPQQLSPQQIQQQQFASQQLQNQPNLAHVQGPVQEASKQENCQQILSLPVQVNNSVRPSNGSVPQMPGGFPQSTPSNNSSVTSLKTLQSNGWVKSLGILNNNSDNSIEINVKSDSNLLSVSNYTLVRSASNTPQTSISNSLDDDSKSNHSRPTSGTNDSMDENLGILKESNTESETQTVSDTGFTLKTPETQSNEIFTTPMGTNNSTPLDAEKFLTPETSPVYEPKDILNDPVGNDILPINSGISTEKSVSSSVYSSDNDSNIVLEVMEDGRYDSDATPRPTPIQTPQAFDTRLSSPRTITPIRLGFDKIASKDVETLGKISRQSSISSNPHEDVDDLLNDYQNESPASQKRQHTNDVIYQGSPPTLGNDVSLRADDDIQEVESNIVTGDNTDVVSKALQDDSVPKRGDITIVNERVVRDVRISASSSLKSLNAIKREEQMPSPTISDTEVKDNVSQMNLDSKKESDKILDNTSKLFETSMAKERIKVALEPPKSNEIENIGEEQSGSNVDATNDATNENNDKPKLMLDVVDKPKLMLDVVDKPKLMLDVVDKPKLMLDVVDKPRLMLNANDKKGQAVSTTEIPIGSELNVENKAEIVTTAKAGGSQDDPRTPTKPKKKPPSNSPLQERIFDDKNNLKDKSLPTTPKSEKRIVQPKSPSSASGKSIWTKIFKKQPGNTTQNEDQLISSKASSDIKARLSFAESRSSSDMKSMNSSFDTSMSSNVTKSSTNFKFKKLSAAKKSFSFKDLKLSSFKNNSEETAVPPLPNILNTNSLSSKPSFEDKDSLLVPEELTLTKLPSFEAEENIFDDMMVTFDEKLDKVSRRATIKSPLNVKEPFLKDDELTMDQIEDQQLKDKMINEHSRRNSEDDYIDENLLFLKDELIWPIETISEVKSVKSVRSADDKSNRNSIAALVASNESESPIGGEEDVFYIDNEQLNNLFNNISDSQRRKLPMHLKYIKQFKDYNTLEINVKKFENLKRTKVVVKDPTIHPILKRTSRLRNSNLLNSRDRRSVQPPKNKVQFSNKIVVNETFAPDVYSRYNRSVTQYTLSDPLEIARMKHEMNEYKCNEMLVHERSQNNTHFFY